MHEAHPRLSVVIVTYNSATRIRLCLDALKAQPDVHEVVVVDNASEDGTVSAVSEHPLQTRILRLARNVGFGRACNAGADEATGDLLLFLNPDVEVESLPALARLGNPTGLIGGYLKEGDRCVPTGRRESGLLADAIRETLVRLLPRVLSIRLEVRTTPTQWLVGALLVASREEFLRLGGFDDRFFMFYEDRELARRYRAQRLPISVHPALRGRHSLGSSSVAPGIGVVRQGWSIMSWIEYVALTRGTGVASLMWGIVKYSLKVASSILGLPMVAGTSIARRKRRELLHLREFVDLQVQRSDLDRDGFLPAARTIIAGSYFR